MSGIAIREANKSMKRNDERFRECEIGIAGRLDFLVRFWSSKNERKPVWK